MDIEMQVRLCLRIPEPPSNRIWLAYFYLADSNYFSHFIVRYPVVMLLRVQLILVNMITENSHAGDGDDTIDISEYENEGYSDGNEGCEVFI